VVVSDGRLLAIALDPQFERTHFVYTISTAAPASATPTFVLARFREVSGTFGDRVILLDHIRAGEPSGAALRFGSDGALYAAFDAGRDEAAANDLASPQGKVLRMNADGSTPGDQAGGSPLFAAGFLSPRGIAWQPGSGMLWVAEQRGTLAAVEAQSDVADRKKRGVTRRQYALPESIAPSSIAFAGDDLLVAAEPGRRLLRIRFDEKNPLSIVGTEHLLQDRIGPIHAVAAGADGTIYVAADRAVARLVRVTALHHH
jgi:glucose/arabinose dehydrogenase